MSASASASARPLSSSARSRRPLSAIFLGNPSQLPDLPEPPHTATASSPASSGLPSPPASTSTGSDSTRRDRDEGDASVCDIRSPTPLMRSHAGEKSSEVLRSASRASNRSSVDEYAASGGDEEDTARLSSLSNESTLQRVKSLTQRNRLVLDKLASISSGSRLSTPSPTAILQRRSPAPSTSNSAGSSFRSRKRAESISKASGSETERDDDVEGQAEGEDFTAQTPTSTTGTHFRTSSLRERRSSASISVSNPSLARLKERDRSIDASERSDAGSSRRPFRPASRSEDIEAAALAAVAQTRRQSPIDMSLRSHRSDSMSNLIPSTPRRERTYSGFSTPSSTLVQRHDSPMTPQTKSSRFSTVRDLTRRHQTRWLTQDISPQKDMLDDESNLTRRARLPDSPARFVGESLRAAGLVRVKEGDDDVFGEGDVNRRLRLSSELGARPSTSRLLDSSRPGTRLSERHDHNAASDTERFQTPAQRLALGNRVVQSHRVDRPATSMASYHEEPRTAPPMLRTYNSSLANNDPVQRPSSRANQLVSSMSTIGRRTTVSPLNIAATAAAGEDPEHSHLMLDALQVFESQLSRLPSMGTVTTQTLPELYHASDGIVKSAEGLCHLLRRGTARCVENQIDAELNENLTRAELESMWRECSGFFRDGTRFNDEVMRLVTSFLLSTARVLKEVMNESAHGRAMSLDETVLRRGTPSLPQHPPSTAGGASASGRQSEGSKQSSDGQSSLDGSRRWIASSGEMKTSTSITSLNSGPVSASVLRPSASSRVFSKVDRAGVGNTSSDSELNSRSLARLSLLGPRRLESIKDMRESPFKSADAELPNDVSYAADTEGVGPPSAESSFSRHRNSISRRSNTMTAPPPLPTILSESVINRKPSTSSKASTMRRPKVSGAIRASTLFPALSSGAGEPTTAVNTAQASPERPSNARSSTVSISRAFSRAPPSATTGLQQLSERGNRTRTTSASSTMEGETKAARLLSERERSLTKSRNADRDGEDGSARPRMSLDSSLDSNATTATTFTARTARDRRGTVTSLFPRS